ncbi:MAG TPA: DMT family transporter, partial [Deltaproteobacteria bacterium]|nr:DMT family transporter [Deltaproteobacteria bacterium]
VEPFIFNGVRFALGALSLVPMMMFKVSPAGPDTRPTRATILTGSLAAGIALFLGVSLQQVGIVSTTAGKAGFITGLYVVLVPVLSLVWGQHVRHGTWIGVLCAATGLYLLSIKSDFTIERGDFLVLLGAVCWAAHVHIIGRYASRIGALRLSLYQYLICTVLSLAVAFICEHPTLDGLSRAAVPIIYGGVFSVGIAYTLQVVAQKQAHPAHAAIILSLESVFAAVGGWLILGEFLSLRAMTGCALMLAGMIISQLGSSRSS